MADRYTFSKLSKGYPYAYEISAPRARQLYEDASARPDADLDGDLETGFHYYADSDGEVRLVRCHVTPLPD